MPDINGIWRPIIIRNIESRVCWSLDVKKDYFLKIGRR